MARLYDNGDNNACPGEENCQVWLSAAEDSPIRCPSCPKRSSATASDGLTAETFDEEFLLDRVDRFRQERNSGRRIYELLTPLEWEMLLAWDEILESYKRAHEIRIAQGMATLMATFTVR